MENLTILTTLCMCIVLLMVKNTAAATCPTGDCVAYDISTQAICLEVSNKPSTSDCRWAAGLNINVDQVILNGSIVAYKIQWFSGLWSGWYVPGVNDIDGKYNPSNSTCSVPYNENTIRRVWAYFYDHTHSYIICKNL
ncbi:hypothetical protein CHS0354_030742 [Potamilus streckersoni]|uniref:C-type lectin n=1 Tax=Potamilus streckersoni TaxID=2493646 RepID=A0AAE0TDB3_9BIVA|nr:hypothetical protein CHS0354_030742 [Potamilus streckersoni]